MPSQIIKKSLEKRLLDGVRASRMIINLATLMLNPDRAQQDLLDPYNKIKNIFNSQLQNSDFLNSASIVESILDREIFEPFAKNLVSIINISLATYMVFSKTELDNVLNSFFTSIIPSTTEIEDSIAEAYYELLHKVALDQVTSTDKNFATFIEALKRERPKLTPQYEERLNKCELRCLASLEKGEPSMSDGQFIMLWSKALRSVIKQSMPIRKILISFPIELELAANKPHVELEEQPQQMNQDLEDIDQDMGDIDQDVEQLDQAGDDDGDDDVFYDASQDLAEEEEEEEDVYFAAPDLTTLSSKSSREHTPPRESEQFEQVSSAQPNQLPPNQTVPSPLAQPEQSLSLHPLSSQHEQLPVLESEPPRPDLPELSPPDQPARSQEQSPSAQPEQPQKQPPPTQPGTGEKRLLTVAEVVNSGEMNPFISNVTRYRTSLFDGGSYSRKRLKVRKFL